MLGVLSAANATGQLIFLPVLASMVGAHGWRAAALVVAAAAVVVFAIVLVFMRDRPEDLGLRPYGRAADAVVRETPPLAPLSALAMAARTRAFWLLAGTFFVCGASTNGLIGTHLIAACHDYGIHEVQSAQLLAMMGVFDILGTTISGWLTDRYSSRYLLFGYYTLRGLSLLALPLTLRSGASSLVIFAVFYGLDWIATVPPTVRLTSEAFGRENTGVIYGWIGASHQLGGAKLWGEDRLACAIKVRHKSEAIETAGVGRHHRVGALNPGQNTQRTKRWAHALGVKLARLGFGFSGL